MRILFARLCAAAFAAPFLLLSACASSERWVAQEFDQVSYERLWAVSQGALIAADYEIGEAEREAGRLESRWYFSPWMFANDAWRQGRESLRQPRRFRAHVRLEERDGHKWNVAVRVERERNTDMVDPSNEARATWWSEPDDEEKARALLFRIENSIRVWTDSPANAEPTAGAPTRGL